MAVQAITVAARLEAELSAVLDDYPTAQVALARDGALISPRQFRHDETHLTLGSSLEMNSRGIVLGRAVMLWSR